MAYFFIKYLIILTSTICWMVVKPAIVFAESPVLERVNDEHTLLSRLRRDIQGCEERTIVFVAGHFPLNITRERTLKEDFDVWGCFSHYSLELAAKLGTFARSCGKQVFFALICDDRSFYSPDGVMLDPLIDPTTINPVQWRTPRRKIFRERSGIHASLPEPYRDVLLSNGFDETNILRHDQGKKDRESCLYFSETVLRASMKKIDDSCTRAYTEFLEGGSIPLIKGEFYVVGFIPQCCNYRVCQALDKEMDDFRGSHVFMETTGAPSRERLYTIGRGVQYKRNA